CDAGRQPCDRRRIEDAMTDDPQGVPALLGHEDVPVWQKGERPRIDQPFDGSNPDGRGRCPENLRCIRQARGTAGRWLLSAAARGHEDKCERRDRRRRMPYPHRSGHAQLLAGGRWIIQLCRGFYRRQEPRSFIFRLTRNRPCQIYDGIAFVLLSSAPTTLRIALRPRTVCSISR